MVESLRELNKLCQKPRYKEVGNWMVRNILRDAALPLTWLLLHTPVTANQVTLFSLIVSLIGIFLLAFPGAGYFLSGMLLLQFWYYLDHVDGQIARYRKTSCLSGRFYDFITHHIVHGCLFFGLGCYGVAATGNFIFAVWGFIASISIMIFNLSNDTKYKTFFEKILTLDHLTVRKRETEPKNANSLKFQTPVSPYKKVFSFLHKISEVHVLMNILTVGAFLEVLSKSALDLRMNLFVFYGMAVPSLVVVKITYLILKKKIDQEFEEQFSF